MPIHGGLEARELRGLAVRARIRDVRIERISGSEIEKENPLAPWFSTRRVSDCASRCRMKSSVPLPNGTALSAASLHETGKCGSNRTRWAGPSTVNPNTPRKSGDTIIAADHVWCGEAVESGEYVCPESTSVVLPLAPSSDSQEFALKVSPTLQRLVSVVFGQRRPPGERAATRIRSDTPPDYRYVLSRK